jgi:Flp pilus assembly protein TadD
MSDAPKAVFLSYASQDADAAKRICEALRASGVEVWFDVEGGLETGDEWDAKIRRQIKECVLFLPVISANTQAREEGYFRIEWELAAQRALGIAGGVAFILPIVVDDTREPDALVPDRFRSVQWTRARGGELTTEQRAKLAKLWSHRAGLARHRATESAAPAGEADPSPTPAAAAPARGLPRWTLGIALGVVAVSVAVVLFLTTRRPAAEPATTPTPAPVASAPAARDWPRSAELKRVIALLDGLEIIPEDFRLAEEIATRVLEKSPGDPEAVTVMARVHSMWLLRGWDRSNARYQKARSTAERALQLAPDEPEAHIALAIFLYTRNVELPRALALAQRAVDLRPDEPRFHRMRDNCLWNLNVPVSNVFLDLSEEQVTPGLKQALASARATVERFPRDPLVRYELSRHYRDIGWWADFERVNDETIALYPVANALVWKARARFGLHGDLAGMKAVLDQVPARVRGIERTVFGYFLYAAYTGETGIGLDVLNGFTEPWMIDFDFRGPKAQLVAALLELSGRKELARIQYELALTELKQSRTRNPEDVQTYVNEAWVLHGLGRTEEARVALRTFNEALIRPANVSPLSTWWFQAIPANLLLGERAFALTLIREAVASRPDGRDTIRRRLALDPRLAAFRADPEIRVLLADPAPARAAAAAPSSEAAQLAARAKALYMKIGYSRDDLDTAEALARRATELEPDSAAAWGALAAVHGTFVQRGWDSDPRRREDAQRAATRALSLDPDQTEALFALGYVFSRQGAVAQAEQAFRRAVKAAPQDTRLIRALSGTVLGQGRTEEGRALLEAEVRRGVRDPLLHYNLAQSYLSYGQGGTDPQRLEPCLRHLDAAIAIEPLATLLLQKAAMQLGWQGDLAGTRATLKQLEQRPLHERTDDRAIFIPLWAATLERDPAGVAAAAALTTRTYFEDWVVHRRPRDWHIALARRIEGKENLARLAWQRAEAVVRERLRENPADTLLTFDLATTLAWLGRAEEADALFAPLEAAWREELGPMRAMQAAHYHAARGDGAKVAAYLPKALDSSVTFTRHTFPLDPWFDGVRDHAEVRRVLAEKGAGP